MPRSLLLLATLALVACPKNDDGDDNPTDDTDDTDTEDTEDTDTEDTDTDDTDVVDTDETGWPSSSTLTTIRDIRLGNAGPTGQRYGVRDAVVVAVRTESTDRGFAIQDPSAANNGGIWVEVDAGAALPAIGDEVEVVGNYAEDDLGLGGSAPNATRATLVVTAADTDSRWTATGTATLPSATGMSVTVFSNASEAYESMLVALNDDPITVVGAPMGDDIFSVTGDNSSSAEARVGAWFYDASGDLPNLSLDDTFDAIAGAVFFDGDHGVGPTSFAGFTGYVDAVEDTGDTGDTDTDTDVMDTSETGDTDTDTDTDLPDDTGPTGLTFESTPPILDTAVDTDTAVNTGPVNSTEIDTIQRDIVQVNQLVGIEGVVVTAVRQTTSPPNSNTFTVQDPSVITHGGIEVFVGTSTNLPQINEIIDVVGMYEEVPSLAMSSDFSHAQINLTNHMLAGWTSTGSFAMVGGAVEPPTPIGVQTGDLTAATAEQYESMLVDLRAPSPFEVSSVPNQYYFYASHTFGPPYALVATWYYDVQDDHPTLGIPDTFSEVRGVLRYVNPNNFGEQPYRVNPVGTGAVTGYVDQ